VQAQAGTHAAVRRIDGRRIARDTATRRILVTAVTA
jgi:hypothetical protein